LLVTGPRYRVTRRAPIVPIAPFAHARCPVRPFTRPLALSRPRMLPKPSRPESGAGAARAPILGVLPVLWGVGLERAGLVPFCCKAVCRLSRDAP
jgi:hypothetical protein